MTLAPAVATTLAVIAGLIHLMAKVNVHGIRANPDPYPFNVLSREPSGEELFLDRPDGTRLRTMVHGNGPHVVLLHGYGVSLLEWNIIWQLLRDTGYRLIAYDHRGHGQSTLGAQGIGSVQMASDVKAVLDYFDVRDGVLVGHSMGGFLALVFLLTHPEAASARLKHCLILGSHAGDLLRGSPQNRLQILLMKTGILQRLVRNQTYGWALGASIYGERPAPSGIEVFRQVFAAQQHGALLPILQAQVDENYYNRLGEITLPCTVVYGGRDKTTPAHHSEALHRGLATSRLIRIEKAGHMLNWEAPETIAEVIQSIGIDIKAPLDKATG